MQRREGAHESPEILTITCVSDVEVFRRSLNAARNQRDTANHGESDVLLSESSEELS